MVELLWVALWWLLLKAQRMSSNVSPESKRRILAALAALGWPEREVDALIQFESGWNSAAKNVMSNASGLIQFMPATLKSLGFHPELEATARAKAMQALSADEQLPWIVRYFQQMGKQWKVPGDAYLVVAAPAYVGAPDHTVIYAIGSRAWVQNPAWRDGPTGPVTAGSIRRIILNRLGAA